MLTLITWSRCSLTPTPTPRVHHGELVGIQAWSQKTAWSSTVSSQMAYGLEGKLSGYHDAAQSLIPGMAPGRWRCPFSAHQGGGGVGWLQPVQQPCPNRSLSTDCPIVTNSSSLGHTLSRVWRLSRFLQGPVEEESAPWKWGAHPSSPEAPWAWQWATETPSSLQFRGPHHQLPQDAQHPWDELEALFPVAPLLFCSLSGSLSVPRISTMWKPRGRPALS